MSKGEGHKGITTPVGCNVCGKGGKGKGWGHKNLGRHVFKWGNGNVCVGRGRACWWGSGGGVGCAGVLGRGAECRLKAVGWQGQWHVCVWNGNGVSKVNGWVCGTNPPEEWQTEGRIIPPSI